MPQPHRRTADQPTASPPPTAEPSPRVAPVDVLSAVAREEPTLSPESVRLLAAQLLGERGALPEELSSVGLWVKSFRRHQPIAWPAIIGADPRRLVHLLEFSSYGAVVPEPQLRQLMASLAQLS